MDCDIVIQGGGVKGIAFAGALTALENAGYQGLNFAGTSAGSMVAALLAAGYSAKEIKTEMENIDYKKGLGETFIDKFGIGGKSISLFDTYGIYNNNYLETLLAKLLARKGVTVFGDLPAFSPNGNLPTHFCNLCVTTTDLTTGKLLVLPDDLAEFGIDPVTFPVVKAVKASISFPLFYEPVILKDKSGVVHYLVDGGLISAYPMFILDDGQSSLKRAVIGLRLQESLPQLNDIKNFVDYVKSMVSTLIDVHDEAYSQKARGDYERSIFIPTVLPNGQEVKTMQFDLRETDVASLYNNGLAAGTKFLLTYSFQDWHKKFRS